MNNIEAIYWRREFIDLSVKQYILNQPSQFLGYDFLGLPILSTYTIDDFAAELKISVGAIRKWGKTGIISKKYEGILIKKGILPTEWELFK